MLSHRTDYFGFMRRLRHIGATWPSILAYPFVRRLTGEYRLRFRNGVALAAPYSEPLVDLLQEIWSDGSYLLREMEHNRVKGHIVDIGANVGTFAVWAAKRWPGTKLVCVEPDSELFRYLQRNVRASGLATAVLVNAACGAKSRETELYARGPRSMNTLYARDIYGSTFTLRSIVQVIPLDRIFATHGIDQCSLLKLDCEGAEYEILLGTSLATLQRIGNIALEYHMGMNDHSPDELVQHLRSCGYAVRVPAPSAADPEVGYMYATRWGERR
jgi:FkbM family methyltransferase